MTRKIIVTDIDGTLLNSSKEISSKTLQALIRWQEEGNLLVLASGRPSSGMFKYAKDLRMDEFGGLLISSNGACVVDVKTQEILWERPMSHSDAKALLDHLENFDVIPMISIDDRLYVNDVFNNNISFMNQSINIIQYESRGGGYKLSELDHLKDALTASLYKVLVAGVPQYLIDNREALSKPFEKTLTSMFTAPFYFEFTDKGVDKANALEFVLDTYNIRDEHTLAFGDGENDISLLKRCKHAIAMSNAVDSLKEVSTYVSLSHDEDGIAHALDLYYSNTL